MSLKIDMDNIVNGKDDATNMGACLLRIVMKADPHNIGLLRKGFPNAVKTVLHWRETGELIDLPYD